MTTTRSQCRQAVAEGLRGKLGAVVTEIYPYKTADPKGASPVVVISSSGTWPAQRATSTYWTRYYFAVNLLVIYADPESDWTEEKAENTLDVLSAEITEALFEMRQTVLWRDLTVYDRSFVDEAKIGNVVYMVETILISVEVE